MIKTTASQLPLREKKLNRMLSINYLSLRSLFLASIYVSPYLATAFHRAQKVASGTNRQTEIRLRYRGSPNSPQFWSIALGNSSPP
jgi:hypothetical protein